MKKSYSIFLFICFLPLCLFDCFFNTIYAEDCNNTKYEVLVKDNESIKIVTENFQSQGINIIDEVPEINLILISTDKNPETLKLENNSYIDGIVKENETTVKPEISYWFGERQYTNDESDFWLNQWDMQKCTQTGEKFTHKSSGNSVVGVIDSGIDYSNSEIASSIISAQNFTTDSEGNVDSGNIADKIGHGTSVVGQISSNGKYLGIAPNMRVRMYRVFDEENARDLWILRAIIQAANDDVDVLNLSLGEYLINASNCKDYDSVLIEAYQRAIDYAHNQGTAIVASVGDEGLDLTNQEQLKSYIGSLNGDNYKENDGQVKDIPAELDNVVTVGSIGDSDRVSSFSNKGNGIIDIYATGGGSERLLLTGYEEWLDKKLYEKDFVLVPTLEGKYTYEYGTSLSAPKVSATLGLIIEKYHLKDKPDEAIKILYNTCSRLCNDATGGQFRVLDITNLVR